MKLIYYNVADLSSNKITDKFYVLPLRLNSTDSNFSLVFKRDLIENRWECYMADIHCYEHDTIDFDTGKLPRRCKIQAIRVLFEEY